MRYANSAAPQQAESQLHRLGISPSRAPLTPNPDRTAADLGQKGEPALNSRDRLEAQTEFRRL
jgi:hypothetical protein